MSINRVGKRRLGGGGSGVIKVVSCLVWQAFSSQTGNLKSGNYWIAADYTELILSDSTKNQWGMKSAKFHESSSFVESSTVQLCESVSF